MYTQSILFLYIYTKRTHAGFIKKKRKKIKKRESEGRFQLTDHTRTDRPDP